MEKSVHLSMKFWIEGVTSTADAASISKHLFRPEENIIYDISKQYLQYMVMVMNLDISISHLQL